MNQSSMKFSGGAFLLLLLGSFLIASSAGVSANAFMADPLCGSSAEGDGPAGDADLLCLTGGCTGTAECAEIYSTQGANHVWCGCPGETESNCCHMVILVNTPTSDRGTPWAAGNCTACSSASGVCCVVSPIAQSYNAECLTSCP